jgi:hypothetical protein
MEGLVSHWRFRPVGGSFAAAGADDASDCLRRRPSIRGAEKVAAIEKNGEAAAEKYQRRPQADGEYSAVFVPPFRHAAIIARRGRVINWGL